MKAGILCLCTAVVCAVPIFGQTDDSGNNIVVEIDKLEYRARDGGDALVWDQAIGLGDVTFASSVIYGAEADEFEEIELQLFMTRNISSRFDLSFGVRHDAEPQPSRSYALLGMAGEIFDGLGSSITFFLSDKGDLSARLEFGTELPLADKITLEPTAELNFAFSADPELDQGSGLRDTELRLRLKYEMSENIVPYAGIQWASGLGNTADIIRVAGGDVDEFSALIGFALNF